jgi:hypothetical protein
VLANKEDEALIGLLEIRDGKPVLRVANESGKGRIREVLGKEKLTVEVEPDICPPCEFASSKGNTPEPVVETSDEDADGEIKAKAELVDDIIACLSYKQAERRKNKTKEEGM